MIEPMMLLPAFFAGLLGNVHCFGMCGGLACALGLSNSSKWYYIWVYNLGRIFTYAFLGLLAGLIGSLLVTSLGATTQTVLRIIAGLFIIAMGFYITGWWRGLQKLEVYGAKLWRMLSPLAQNFMPVISGRRAYVLGSLWGFLPCGLVYSSLSWAAASSNALTGALIMLCFGLGTLPAMLATGIFSQALNQVLRSKQVQVSSGMIIIIIGIWTIVGVSLPMSMMMSHHHSM